MRVSPAQTTLKGYLQGVVVLKSGYGLQLRVESWIKTCIRLNGTDLGLGHDDAGLRLGSSINKSFLAQLVQH